MWDLPFVSFLFFGLGGPFPVLAEALSMSRGGVGGREGGRGQCDADALGFLPRVVALD